MSLYDKVIAIKGKKKKKMLLEAQIGTCIYV